MQLIIPDSFSSVHMYCNQAVCALLLYCTALQRTGCCFYCCSFNISLALQHPPVGFHSGSLLEGCYSQSTVSALLSLLCYCERVTRSKPRCQISTVYIFCIRITSCWLPAMPLTQYLCLFTKITLYYDNTLKAAYFVYYIVDVTCHWERVGAVVFVSI